MDRPGHESARLSAERSCWRLAGTAVFVDDGRPCRLNYSLLCDTNWKTLSGSVDGWVGDEVVAVDLSVDSAGRWRFNGNEAAAVAGCIDLDLNFSPSTNLLPIRRLNLAVGQQAEVKAAWLHFPGFALEPLSQIYRRVSTTTYRYESVGGTFATELQIDEAGFITVYPKVWEREASA
ncbi:MAG: putative glycolipid-binding domain-containing protein [Acidobacteria bacterium]|nr:putative glycolipid-binding domain-containing protein [Acidobacteriota bacterium]